MNSDNFDIEDWLDGALGAPERQAFEQEMAQNPAFRAEVEAMRALHARLADAAISQQIARAAAQRARAKTLRKRLWIGVAVLLSVLAAGGLLRQLLREDPRVRPGAPLERTPDPLQTPENQAVKPRPPSPADSGARPPTAGQAAPETMPGTAGRLALVRQFYDPPAAFSNIRADAPGNDFEQLKQLFVEKKYAEALARLPRSNMDAASPEARYFVAHCRLADGQFRAAATDFRAIETDAMAVMYRDAAQWYGLLANLGLGKTGDAERTRLTKLISADAGHPFRAEASALAKAGF